MSQPDLMPRLVHAVEKMPAFPRSVQALLELTRQTDCEPRSVVAVIERDPVITTRILRVVNSAYYGQNRKLSSVTHAVLTLGMNSIKNMALAIAAGGMLPAHNEAHFDTAAYLMHSLAVAGIARHMARQLGQPDASDAYIAGLLHDFGKVVFAQYLPLEFGQALQLSASEGMSLVEAEHSIMGIDHTTAGAMLLTHWKFPEHVAFCVADHHTLSVADGLGRSLFLANQLAKHLALGSAGNQCVDAFPSDWHLGMGEDWGDLARHLPELENIVAEARLFAQPGGVA